MASTASDLLKLELQADGENSGTWGQKANVLFERLEESVAEQLSVSLASLGGANYTLDDTQYVKNSGTTGESHVATLKLTGTMTANEAVIVPGRNKQYLIWNATSGAYTATVKTSGGAGIAVPQGYIQQVFCDATNVEAMGPPVDANGQIYFPKGGDIASASPLVIDTDGDMFDVTGTTGFSAMTVAAGRLFVLQFDGALTMTHGAGTLDLLGAANITTAAGDTGLFYSTAANVVRMISWTPATGYIGQGKHAVPIPATGMYAATTSGAAAGASESSTNKVMIKTYDFDTSADEYVQFQIPMPKSWNESTITAKFYWSHASTTTNFGVAWGIQATSFGDSDALDATWGTGVVTTDTGGTTDDMFVTGESSAITIAGTPAAEDIVIFRVYRDVSDAGDTMAIDARLHAVVLYFTVNAATDA